jgi:metallo-beta-lactamase family protein
MLRAARMSLKGRTDAAEGTLARIIVDGAASVKLLGDVIPVRAHVHTINGLSAHAGQSDLLAWHARTRPEEITFLVHGEDEARQALAKVLPMRAELPRMHQTYEI